MHEGFCSMSKPCTAAPLSWTAVVCDPSPILSFYPKSASAQGATMYRELLQQRLYRRRPKPLAESRRTYSLFSLGAESHPNSLLRKVVLQDKVEKGLRSVFKVEQAHAQIQTVFAAPGRKPAWGSSLNDGPSLGLQRSAAPL